MCQYHEKSRFNTVDDKKIGVDQGIKSIYTYTVVKLDKYI